MNQIGAGRMSPVHWSPNIIIIELIEEVIFALIVDQTVRVIAPAILDRVVVLVAEEFIVINVIRLSPMDIDAIGQAGLISLSRNSAGHR